jgi:hypothetical protein
MVVWTNSISPGFFVTMETPFLAGRDFNEHDTLHAPLVAVIKRVDGRQVLRQFR